MLAIINNKFVINSYKIQHQQQKINYKLDMIKEEDLLVEVLETIRHYEPHYSYLADIFTCTDPQDFNKKFIAIGEMNEPQPIYFCFNQSLLIKFLINRKLQALMDWTSIDFQTLMRSCRHLNQAMNFRLNLEVVPNGFFNIFQIFDAVDGKIPCEIDSGSTIIQDISPFTQIYLKIQFNCKINAINKQSLSLPKSQIVKQAKGHQLRTAQSLSISTINITLFVKIILVYFAFQQRHISIEVTKQKHLKVEKMQRKMFRNAIMITENSSNILLKPRNKEYMKIIGSEAKKMTANTEVNMISTGIPSKMRSRQSFKHQQNQNQHIGFNRRNWR